MLCTVLVDFGMVPTKLSKVAFPAKKMLLDCQNPASPVWIKRFARGIPDGFRYDFSEYFQNETNTKNRMRLLPALHTFGKTNTNAAHFSKTKRMSEKKYIVGDAVL